MAHIQNEDVVNVVDEHQSAATADFEDDHFEKSQQLRDDENSDFEEEEDDDDEDMDNPTTDTSAIEARNGKDIQGIPWENMKFKRDKYRETRLKQYKNYVSLPPSRQDLDKECKEVVRGSTFYNFQFNTRLVKPTIVHFQMLKNGNEFLSFVTL